MNKGRFAFLSITQGMAALQGGVPIEMDGVILGAVGVSGVRATDDEQVALAGVAALGKRPSAKGLNPWPSLWDGKNSHGPLTPALADELTAVTN